MPFGTRWFSLSGRELLSLVAAVALVLLCIGVASVINTLRRPEGIAVQKEAELLPQPVRIDVNTASVHELMLIPGIGPASAERIVEYRTKHGAFANLGELEKVYGIGSKTVELMRPHVMCVPPQQRPEGGE